MTAMGVGELKGLADTLMEDHAVSHKLESIEQAIAIYEEVLRFRPAGHEQRAEAVSDLGDALFHFCHFNGTDETRGHRSIELLREAVRLRPPRHPSRDCSLHMLARALFFIGYEQHSGGLTALTECILLNREALQLRMPGHLERSKSLSNLAAVLLRSFELCGHPDLIAECILVNREALQLEEPGHPHRGATLNNLAIALDDLVAFQGGPEALAKAISLHREALDLRPVGHPRRYSTLDNLANSLTKSFDLHTLPVALSEAIALRREACVLLPDGHPQWATLLSNLADSLITDFRYRRDLCSITEAIALLRRASLLRPSADHIHDTLAEALLAQFIACRDPELLPEAITLRRKVLLMRPHEHTQRPHSLQRLGSLLCQPESQSWSEALALFHEALETCPAGYPGRSLLLSDLSRCYLTPKSPSFDLARGISYLTEGYSDEFSHVNQRLGHAVSDLQQVEVACSEAMRDADASIKNHYSGQVLELHAKVIGILPRAANLGLDHKTRLQVITGSDEIGRNAAARALNLGRTSQAVELLEAGRGIFWSQTLHLRATGFDGIPDSDRENLLRLFRMLEHGARSAESSEQTVEEHEQALARRRLLNKEAEALISRIRDYPGCARFLLPAAFDSLVNGLPDGFVVVLNASKLGHHALLLHKTDEVAVSLELSPPSMGFDFAALRAQLPRDMSDVDPEQQDDIHSRAMRMDSGRVSSLEHVLLQLWTTMARPVVRKLGLKEAAGHNRPRLWWCVTGELGFLPIHAAGEYGGTNSKCITNYVVSSYIPTLSSLTKARSGWEPIPRSSVAGLLVCETYADHGLYKDLPGADKEVQLVRAQFASAHARILNAYSPHTSLADLRSLLQGNMVHVLHLACHGVQDVDPLNSALLMHDGKLTIENMMHLDLPHAVLAYLSACETAKGDRNAPDQAVHLAASMLFCGFRSVVGTMWLMHDDDGPKLARRFYEALFTNETLDLNDIAYALDEAVQDLRHQGVQAQRWALFMHMGG